MIRWQTPISSENSDEMKMTDFPLAGQFLDDQVDLLLPIDVDAVGRLVEDQDVRSLGKPLGDDDLLLVAARRASALAVGRGAS